MAVEGHDGRITVSTLAEARYFAKGGFKDIFYGVGIVPAKLPAVAELRRQGVNLRIVTDNISVARAIAEAATNGDTFSVFIEIDSGGGRAGLPYPELPGLLDIARVLHAAPGVELAGVMTHAGHSYHESTSTASPPSPSRNGWRSSARREAARRRHPLPDRLGRLDADGDAFAQLHRHHRDAAGSLWLQRSRPGVHRLVRRGRSRAVGAGLGDRPLPASQPDADRCRRAGAVQGHQRPGIPAQGRLRHDCRMRRRRTWP